MTKSALWYLYGADFFVRGVWYYIKYALFCNYQRKNVKRLLKMIVEKNTSVNDFLTLFLYNVLKKDIPLQYKQKQFTELLTH